MKSRNQQNFFIENSYKFQFFKKLDQKAKINKNEKAKINKNQKARPKSKNQQKLKSMDDFQKAWTIFQKARKNH